jgi:hypothetical protein
MAELCDRAHEASKPVAAEATKRAVPADAPTALAPTKRTSPPRRHRKARGLIAAS